LDKQYKLKGKAPTRLCSLQAKKYFWQAPMVKKIFRVNAGKEIDKIR
jgi:hypothetical protein